MEKAPRPSMATITKKIIMALTGLFLCGFLVAHLAGNLLLLNTSNKFLWFNTYARTLNAIPFLLLLEIGLLAIILIHACDGYSVWRHNKSARPEDYAEGRQWAKTKSKKSKKTVSSTIMMVSGTVILIFIAMHVWHFKYHNSIGPANPVSAHKAGESAAPLGAVNAGASAASPAEAQAEATDLAAHVVYEFKKPYVLVIYLFCMVALGFHLYHAVWSSFQTLGVTNTKARRAIIVLNGLFTFVIAGTFALLPIWVHFIYKEPAPETAPAVVPATISSVQANQEGLQ